MDYKIEIKPSCKKEIHKACKKNPVLKSVIKKKVSEIIRFPFHYKPLKHELSGERRVHILKSFVLVFEVKHRERTVSFIRFNHHDDVYRR